MTTPALHKWKFFRAGGVDQVMLRDGADLSQLAQLDPKLWVALAMPTRGVELDPRTLDLVDSDQDGRIRVPEVLAAVQWATQALRDPSDLLKGGDAVALSAIAPGPVHSGAKRLLANLGKADATAVTLADVADTAKVFAATRFNGDGVVPVESAEDPETQRALEEVISALGSVEDRSKKPGVNQAKVEAFFKEAQAFADWHSKGAADPAVLVLAAGTAAAAAALKAVKAKVDDAFVRFRLAAFDPRAAAALNRAEPELAALALKELSLTSEEVARLPLARVEAGRALPLGDGLNPAWAKAMAEFAKQAVQPLLGEKGELTEADWTALQAKLAPFDAWQAQKPVTAIEKLGVERVRALLSGGAQAAIGKLIAQDLALEAENAQLVSVERLVRYQRDLFRLLNNFVNFSEFYARKAAVFQVGTLYLDGRSCELCVNVADAAKHAAMANLSAACLAYCDCTRPGGLKLSIAAAFTDGDSDYLMVGRNGVFYDHQGRDWDATITKLVANPISLREAFWSPYKKFVRLVEEQVQKRATAADAEAHQKLDTAAATTAHADKQKLADAKKIDVGTVAAIGVAVGGVGAMLTGVLASFFGLGFYMPLGLVAVVLLISGPSMLLAYLKLRQRNLGPILDANGWAINGRARVNVPFGAALTRIAKVPKGAERALTDPYADKKRPVKLYVALAFVVVTAAGWYLGKLDRYLPLDARSVTVLGDNAPAWVAPPAK